MIKYVFSLKFKSNPEVKNAILSALKFRNERKNKARVYSRGSHLRPGPKVENMINHLVKFNEEEVVNALKELYNDGKIQFDQPTPKPEGLVFHLQLSISLVEKNDKPADDKYKLHFGESDPRFAFYFGNYLFESEKNHWSDSNSSWTTTTTDDGESNFSSTSTTTTNDSEN